MREVNMQTARALVTKAELDGLLASPDSAAPSGPETEERWPPDAGPGGDAGLRMFEQAFRHWEQTVRDLQREVKALRERVDRLERERAVPPFPAAAAPEPPASGGPEAPRLSRVERYRKSRWF